ncbi:TetR/AcrR family transcriptional regulator [Nocardia sp. BSTN01]|uniref:TetR/AcrR family transcriptional regulator n=1 Tax=Nocardia sp. BSTN01 TaxID=2783665 RepID=UPI00188F8411|nr:TetR/AcrR family transcriptional regulator [Nocardia sp. BSTN01]MBF5002502.1 TetR/AcrR family transcriptional regulator [Nocardia sp. BSTN01]
MTVQQRRQRERENRRQLILTTARNLAEKSGWDSVTTRALADTIEYSQPVLYQHFRNKDAIVAAVAQQGFGELAEALHRGRTTTPGGLRGLIEAYVSFAAENPKLYEAMFVIPVDLDFGVEESPDELVAAFGEIIAALEPLGAPRDRIDTVAEVVWSACDGLVTLERSGRLRPAYHAERIELLTQQILATPK